MKKKLFLALVIVSALVCLFALSVNAAEYVVSDDGGYSNVSSAFNAAADGDTIIIKKNVTDSFNFTKAITYKLEGVTWKCSAGSTADMSGKQISIIATGTTNSSFIPNGSCWLNSAQNLGTLTWNFGGTSDNVKLIFDFSSCNRRLLYNANSITMNLLPYVDLTNYVGKIDDGTNDRCIRVKELNIYDNGKIYKNRAAFAKNAAFTM